MKEPKTGASKAGQALSELGASKGGKARAKSLTKEKRAAIARKAAAARWGESKIPVETHSGVLKIGDTEISCAVLRDGTRVLSERGVTKALGGKRGGAHWRRKKKQDGLGAYLPVFISAPNLKPFIDNDLAMALSNPIIYKPSSGYPANGVEATLLPKICDVWLKIRDAGELHPGQRHIALAADILMRGLAKVGIIALVDEATGYQEVRDRKALQAILDAFLRKELAAWASRFPNEFYHELFRLRGWDWKSKSGHRPRQAGKDTKNIVYARLAPGILEELERRNPPNEDGYRKSRHHQWLTEDIGHPALAQHLHAVMAFMRVSKDWDQFKRMLDQAFPKRGDTLALPFMGDSIAS